MKLVMAELVYLLQRILLETNFLWWVCPLLWKSDFLFSTIRKRSLGKVIFLHLCVILFTGGFGFPACITGHMTKGGSASGGGGSASSGCQVCFQGGGLHPGGLHAGKVCLARGGLHLGVLHPGRIGSASGGLGRYFPPPRALWDTVNKQAVRNLLSYWNAFLSLWFNYLWYQFNTYPNLVVPSLFNWVIQSLQKYLSSRIHDFAIAADRCYTQRKTNKTVISSHLFK